MCTVRDLQRKQFSLAQKLAEAPHLLSGDFPAISGTGSEPAIDRNAAKISFEPNFPQFVACFDFQANEQKLS